MLTHCIDGQIATPARVWPGLADRLRAGIAQRTVGSGGWGGNNLMFIYVRYFFGLASVSYYFWTHAISYKTIDALLNIKFVSRARVCVCARSVCLLPALKKC